jgi:hypothetical protein
MLSVSGCANIDAPVAGCEWVRPIILADDDRLTTLTMRALLAHNEAVAVFCDSIKVTIKGGHFSLIPKN